MAKHRIIYVWVAVVATVFTACGTIKSIGTDPKGADLKQLQKQPNYKNGAFENIAERRDSTKKRNLLFRKKPLTIRPLKPLPWVRTNLKTLPATKPTIVWFGHSSVLVKSEQGNILIDPIFSNHAGPVPGLMTAFSGTTHYHAKDMPPIDILIISHDHYDHLDYQTIKKLKNSLKVAVVPAGIGTILRYWGFDPKKIIELNWYQTAMLAGGIQVTATPAQHRSNRTYGKENKTLWASFVIKISNYNLFYSGDSGYGPHFKDIGKKCGPFDLALLECGQYSPNWLWTHLLFGQAAQAAIDLHANMLMPVHWAKFEESNHPWNEPIKKLVPAARELNVPLTVPRIGEPYVLGNPPKIQAWWGTTKKGNYKDLPISQLSYIRQKP